MSRPCRFCSFLDKHAFANPFLLWWHGLMHAPFEVSTEWPNLFLRIMIRRWRSHSCRKKLHMPHHTRATWVFLNSKVWCVAAADANLQKNSNHLQFTVCFLVCADELQAKHSYHILSNDPRAHGICCEKRGKRLWIWRNLAFPHASISHATTCAGCPKLQETLPLPESVLVSAHTQRDRRWSKTSGKTNVYKYNVGPPSYKLVYKPH